MKLNNVVLEPKGNKIVLTPFGDIHYGLKQCDFKLANDYVKWIKKNEDSRVLLMGDLIDSATKYSRGPQIFEDDITPQEQYDGMIELLMPIKDKIIGLHCLTPDHEVLTKDGFKKYTSLKKGDIVLTFNHNKKISEWKPIEKKMVRSFNGVLKTIHSNCISTEITPDHTLIYYDRNKKYKETLAKDMPSRMSLPVSAINNESKINWSNDFIRLVAWILTEGTMPKDRKDISITQSKIHPKNIKEIKRSLSNLGIPYKVYEYDGRKERVNEQDWINIWINKKHSKQFRDILDKKHIPSELLYNASFKQRQLFYTTLIKGDGWETSKYPGSAGFATKHKSFMVDFAVLCSLIGKRCNVLKRERTINDKLYIGYEASITNRQLAHVSKINKHYSERKYSGPVFDLSVKDNHNFFVKHEKSLFAPTFYFTGNCGNHEYGIYRDTGVDLSKMMAKELGCPYLGYSCFTKIRIGKQNYIIYSTHGSSGATLPHTKIKKCLDLSASFNADIYLYGHTHDLDSRLEEFREIDLKNKSVKIRKKMYVLTGHFLNYEGSYGEQKNYRPAKKGAPKIKLYKDRWDFHCGL